VRTPNNHTTTHARTRTFCLHDSAGSCAFERSSATNAFTSVCECAHSSEQHTEAPAELQSNPPTAKHTKRRRNLKPGLSKRKKVPTFGPACRTLAPLLTFTSSCCAVSVCTSPVSINGPCLIGVAKVRTCAGGDFRSRDHGTAGGIDVSATRSPWPVYCLPHPAPSECLAQRVGCVNNFV